MVKVEILGWGCPRCHRLEALVRELVAQEGVPAEVERITDIGRIASFATAGPLSLPGLLIDGELVATGSVPSRERLLAWILDAVRCESGE